MRQNQELLNLLRQIASDPNASQRKLAKKLGFSLGKLNYCLKSLKIKGMIKIQNFKKNPKKINYVYLLTPKGVSEKAKLTVNFMKLRMREYDQLKKEIEKD